MTHELDTIYLYSQFPLTINKNTTINGLFNDTLFLDYLNNYENRYEINNFPRIEIGMQISLTININDMNKLNGEVLLDRIDGINYLRVEKTQQWGNEEEPRKTNYYYFIDNSYFSSDATITLECTLDTVQSFYFRFKDSINPKSYIEREHRNRFVKDGDEITPLYDKTLENIEIERTYTEVNDDFTLNDGDENKNYLAYRINENIVYGEFYTDNNISELGTLYAVSWSDYTETARFCAFEGTLVVKRSDDKIEIAMRSNKETYIELRDFRNIQGVPNQRTMMAILRDKLTGKILVTKTMSSASGLYTGAEYSLTFHREQNIYSRYAYFLSSTLDEQGYELSEQQAVFTRVEQNTDFTWLKVDITTKVLATVKKCKPTSSLDLTDSSLIKVLDVPYIDLKQLDVLMTSETTLGFYLFNPIVITRTSNTIFMPPQSVGVNIELGMPRVYRIDPKIYTSQFTNYYFIYDDAKIEYKVENSYALDTPIPFTIYYSNNLGSSMLIHVDITMREEEFMEKYVTVNRDNSVPLVNSEYLNYIRNGYEYDMRNLKTEQGKQVTNFLISTIGAIASFGAGAVTGGVTTAMGVGMSVNALNSIVNLSHNKGQGIAKMNQQLKKMQEVAPSVRGTSVDLLRISGNQKIHNIKVSPSEADKNRLENYFYYFGYTTNEFKIPQIETRYYFNYLKGTLDFSFDGFGLKIKNDIINDIVTRFQNGVTIMHLHEDELFDFDNWFTFENWETNLL